MRLLLDYVPMLTNPLLSVAIACVLLAGSGASRAAAAEPGDKTVYLFTSFRGNGDGLHLAWSEDARNWADLGNPKLTPELMKILIEGTKSQAHGQSYPELAAWRDRCLVAVQGALDQETAKKKS